MLKGIVEAIQGRKVPSDLKSKITNLAASTRRASGLKEFLVRFRKPPYFAMMSDWVERGKEPEFTINEFDKVLDYMRSLGLQLYGAGLGSLHQRIFSLARDAQMVINQGNPAQAWNMGDIKLSDAEAKKAWASMEKAAALLFDIYIAVKSVIETDVEFPSD
jgi:hypothetical protein